MPRLNKFCIEDLQSLSILSIAEDLGLKVTRSCKCLCPFHEDKSPSLKFWPSVNGWKCYGCGEKGTNIDLVMKKEGLTFLEACQWIASQYSIMLRYDDDPTTPFIQHSKTIKPKVQISKPTMILTLDSNLITQCQGTSSSFCRSIVATSILTQEQLSHACEVYKLGCTQDDGVIFWQIDQNQQLRDGKVMYYDNDCHRDHKHNPTWISYRLKQKGELTQDWQATYCLFGLHLLGPSHSPLNGEDMIVAVVESEKTAIICSELIPSISGTKVVWMAAGGKCSLSLQVLQPIIGKRVILFPDTDSTGECFRDWNGIAKKANSSLFQSRGEGRTSITVSNLLELHASEEQKRRKIDIADLIIESKNIL